MSDVLYNGNVQGQTHKNHSPSSRLLTGVSSPQFQTLWGISSLFSLNGTSFLGKHEGKMFVPNVIKLLDVSEE